MIKVEFTVLYKSGHEDVIDQYATEKEYKEIIDTINIAFQEDHPAKITFGDGKGEGFFIRMSDVSRIKIRILNSGE